MDLTKTGKPRYLKNKTLSFLQIKKFINFTSRATLWQKNSFVAEITFKYLFAKRLVLLDRNLNQFSRHFNEHVVLQNDCCSNLIIAIWRRHTILDKIKESSEYRAISIFFFFYCDIYILLYFCFIHLCLELYPFFEAMLMWPNFETLIPSCNGIGMYKQHCTTLLHRRQKHVVLRQLWICETCWILCCQTGCFRELCLY